MPTKIPWTHGLGCKGETLNPWVGCTKIRAGCKHCYAERIAKRLKGMRKPAYQDVVNENGWTGKICWQDGQLEKPLKRTKPTMYFWGSMTDIFHEDVPPGWTCHLFDTIEATPQHIHIILTKRPHLMLKHLYGKWDQGDGYTWQYMKKQEIFPNLWPGVSISNQKDADEMIPTLLQIPAAVRFISFEPLLQEITDVSFDSCREDDTGLDEYGQHIDWAIIGCERLVGNKAGRFCQDEARWWAAAKSLVEQAQAAKVPVFFKQGPINGKVSDNPGDWPAWARVQEWPK